MSDTAVTLREVPPGALQVLQPSRGWSALHLAEVWQFRDLLFTLAGRDLKLRYKQTLLGVAWVVLQPLMAAGIFTVVFGKIANLPANGAPNYFVFAFAGQMGWMIFSNTVGKASGCLVGNAHLISKVYFPRLILPFSTVPSTLVDFAAAALMMAGLMIWFGIVPGLGFLLLPVWIAILFAMAMGVGLVAASLSVTYRDVQFILPVFIQMLMYASPVAYAVPSSGKYKLFFDLNPVSPVLEGFRWSLLNTDTPPQWGLVGISAAASAVILFVGVFTFKRMERQFADIV